MQLVSVHSCAGVRCAAGLSVLALLVNSSCACAAISVDQTLTSSLCLTFVAQPRPGPWQKVVPDHEFDRPKKQSLIIRTTHNV